MPCEVLRTQLTTVLIWNTKKEINNVTPFSTVCKQAAKRNRKKQQIQIVKRCHASIIMYQQNTRLNKIPELDK